VLRAHVANVICAGWSQARGRLEVADRVAQPQARKPASRFEGVVSWPVGSSPSRHLITIPA